MKPSTDSVKRKRRKGPRAVFRRKVAALGYVLGRLPGDRQEQVQREFQRGLHGGRDTKANDLG